VINSVQLFRIVEINYISAMAACTNGTCKTRYYEQPVSEIDMPVKWVIGLKLSALMNKIGVCVCVCVCVCVIL
jgi:hypothetical protein